MKAWHFLIVVGFTALLFGCGGDENEDLKSWIQSVKARPPGAIPPMPELKPQEEFRYAASIDNVRSPFAAYQLGQVAQLTEIIAGCPEDAQPDPNRRKEDLERYTLETLKMVGVIGKNNALEAIVRGSAGNNAGIVYRVGVGSHMGINHGRISKISEDRITLEERIPDGTGCWIKRDTFLALGE